MALDLTPAEAGQMIHALEERLQVVEQGLVDKVEADHERYQRLETMILNINDESTPKSHFVENINFFIFVNCCFC